MASGKHRADGGDGYSVHGRANRGADDGHQEGGRQDEDRATFDQALADRMAADHQGRQDRK